MLIQNLLTDIFTFKHANIIMTYMTMSINIIDSKQTVQV